MSKGTLPASSSVGLPGASEEGRGREAFSPVPGLGADPRRQPCDQDAPVHGWEAGAGRCRASGHRGQTVAGSAAQARGPQGCEDTTSQT